VGVDGDPIHTRSSAVTVLAGLLGTVRPATTDYFMHGYPGCRAYCACLAVLSAALCWNQSIDLWEGADAAAWELLLVWMLPLMLDMKEAAPLLAVGGVQEQQQQEPQQQVTAQLLPGRGMVTTQGSWTVAQPSRTHSAAGAPAVQPQQQELQQQQQQQEQQQQQQAPQEKTGSLASQQGSQQHRGQADPGAGGGHTSHTPSEGDTSGSHPAAAADSQGDMAQAHEESDLTPPAGDMAQSDEEGSADDEVCPPADLALLLLMAAARAVKAGVNYHCFGSNCSLCDWWHPREGVGNGSDSDQEDEQEGGSERSARGEHDPHQEQPSGCHGGRSNVESTSKPAGNASQKAGPERIFSPGLKKLDQLEEALDTLLSLVHCLVVRGAWWQQAVAQHPLLLLQVLLTVADVSVGSSGEVCMNEGWCIRDSYYTVTCIKCTHGH
jgi:hypothetical protein